MTTTEAQRLSAEQTGRISGVDGGPRHVAEAADEIHVTDQGEYVPLAVRKTLRRVPGIDMRLGAAERMMKSLWGAIAEHRRHIDELDGCMSDELLRVYQAAAPMTFGDRVDVIGTLAYHCGFTVTDIEDRLTAARRRQAVCWLEQHVMQEPHCWASPHGRDAGWIVAGTRRAPSPLEVLL